ncbi:LIC_10190 family membrane protein [Hymenobacter sp. BT491]|uniref:LIC_10190 family membrane protein n=1 Tax=Hymenobacter sp. BT491 TaxID=2766779 RepID=UPI0016539588|nr:hypothetical protein [Hymenobacter sp. BT491]MBC6990823.1 hypothetical protein [Hymenobacter sp. BT491]
MILLLLAGMYATLVPLGWGVWFVQAIRLIFRGRLPDTPVSALTTWLGGLALLTVLLQLWSVAGPIHTGAHIVASLLGVAGLLHSAGRHLLQQLVTRVQEMHRLVQGLSILLIFSALLVSSMPPLNVDTGLYHAQAVRWLEEVGVVPGLANIDIHIGYNPAWFVPEALFSWGRYVGYPLHLLDMVLFCLFGVYGLLGLEGLIRGQFRPVDVLRVALTATMTLWLLEELPSLSPDPPAAIIVFFLLLQAILLPLPAKGDLTIAHVAVMLLCVFAVTLKLSVVPVLLLPAWWLFRSRQGRSGYFLAMMAALSLVLVAPWCLRNVLISGYLIFPLAAIDLFNPDWKFPVAELEKHVVYIREFARNEQFYSEISIHGKPMSFWLPLWWVRQSLHNKLLAVALPLLLVIAVPFGVRQYRQGRFPQAKAHLGMLAIAVGGIVFWAISAPSFRFGYGFLLSTLCLLLLPFIWEIALRNSRLLVKMFSGALVSIIVVIVFSIEYRNFLLPKTLTPREYTTLLRGIVPTPDRTFIQTHYLYVPANHLFVLDALPIRTKMHSIGILINSGKIHNTKGLMSMANYWFRPAPYSVNEFRPLQLGSLHLWQVKIDDIPWYAPFPYVARPQLCYPRGNSVAAGFGPRVKPNIRNWQFECNW